VRLKCEQETNALALGTCRPKTINTLLPHLIQKRIDTVASWQQITQRVVSFILAAGNEWL
jgi:hypothetical protein